MRHKFSNLLDPDQPSSIFLGPSFAVCRQNPETARKFNVQLARKIGSLPCASRYRFSTPTWIYNCAQMRNSASGASIFFGKQSRFLECLVLVRQLCPGVVPNPELSQEVYQRDCLSWETLVRMAGKCCCSQMCGSHLVYPSAWDIAATLPSGVAGRIAICTSIPVAQHSLILFWLRHLFLPSRLHILLGTRHPSDHHSYILKSAVIHSIT